MLSSQAVVLVSDVPIVTHLLSEVARRPALG